MLRARWFLGGLAGAVCAGAALVVAHTRLGEPLGAEALVQGLSSLPMYLSLHAWPKASDGALVAVFVVYWVAVGALAGWAFGKGRPWRVAAAAVILVLALAHLQTKAVLEEQLAGAARAFGNFFMELESLRSLR